MSDQLRANADVTVKNYRTAEHRTIDAVTVIGSDAVLLLAGGSEEILDGEGEDDLHVLARDGSVRQLWEGLARMGVERRSRDADGDRYGRREWPDIDRFR